MTIPALVVLMTSVSPTELLEFPSVGLLASDGTSAPSPIRISRAPSRTGSSSPPSPRASRSLIGSAFAYLIDRYTFAGRAALEAILSSPLIVPHFTTGFGFLLLGANLASARAMRSSIAAHVLLTLPFVIRSVYVSLRNLDPALERAAANLGASPFERADARDIAAPSSRHGGRLARRGDPIAHRIHRLALRHRAAHADPCRSRCTLMCASIRDPTIAAISALLIIFTTLLMLLANRYLGLRRILAIDAH